MKRLLLVVSVLVLLIGVSLSSLAEISGGDFSTAGIQLFSTVGPAFGGEFGYDILGDGSNVSARLLVTFSAGPLSISDIGVKYTSELFDVSDFRLSWNGYIGVAFFWTRRRRQITNYTGLEIEGGVTLPLSERLSFSVSLGGAITPIPGRPFVPSLTFGIGTTF